MPPTRRSPAPRGRLAGPALIALSGLLLAAGVLPLLAGGCGRAPRAPRVLIVGVDGADWRIMGPLLEAGELPHLQALMQQGVSAPLLSLYPIISPVIWTTLATGKGPDKHGILDFTMPDPQSGQPVIVGSNLRQSKAFWNILSEQGLRVAVLGWWASWPAEPIADGVIVSDRISFHAFLTSPAAESGLVHPERLQSRLLDLRMDATEVSHDIAREFMDVTAEEYAAAPAQDFSDPISHFRHIYATMANYAAMARAVVAREGPDVLAVYFEGVDTAGHMYMRYAPPEYPSTTAEQRRKFDGTVAAFYRYQDRLIGELLELTDEQTTVMVVSDHGFVLGPERPIEPPGPVNYATASRWHRPHGVLIMKGPQILESGRPPAASPLRGASVFDFTPTLLALLGMSPGSDMDGRVLTEGLREGFVAPTAIPSHEDDAWREERLTARAEVSGVDEEMQERLRSLGYIGAGEYEQTLSLRAQWGLAEYYMYREDFDRAQEVLEEVRGRAPELPETYYLLGVIHLRRQDFAAAETMYLKSLELAPDKLEAQMDLATLYRATGRMREAAGLLERAVAGHPQDTRLQVNLGMLYREMQQLDRAELQFREILERDAQSHPAHAQLALICEQRGRAAEAITHWEAALRIAPNDRTAQQHLQQLRGSGAAPAGGR